MQSGNFSFFPGQLITEKLKEAEEKTKQVQQEEQEQKQSTRKTTAEKDKSIFDDPIVKSMTRTAGNTIVRSLLGALGLGGRSRKRLF